MSQNAFVQIPYSKEKEQIAKTLKKNEFIKDVKKDTSEKFPTLKLELADKKLTLTRISKPGQRIYKNAKDIRKVLNGFGIAIISTSNGIMTGYEARSQNIGGELLCEVS